MTAALLYSSRNTTVTDAGGGNKRCKHKAPCSENQISVLCPNIKIMITKKQKEEGGEVGADKNFLNTSEFPE